MRKILQLSLIIAIVSSTAACSTGATMATLLVGGVAAGYYVGKDDRNVEVIARDASTTPTIKAWYLRDKELNAFKINVDTYKGVVTLYGTVDTKETEMKAMKIAAKAEGVTKVISKLTVLEESHQPTIDSQ